MARATFPSTFDIELDSERGRWLRRRFLWFCVTGILVSAPFLHGAFQMMLTERGSLQIAAIVWHGSFIFSWILFVGAFVHAWRSPPQRQRILRVAVWLSCLTGVLTLLSLRIAVAIDPRALHISDVSTDARDSIQMTTETVAMFLSIYFVFLPHVLPCLLLPWTVREAAPLTILLPGTFIAIAVIDTAVGRINPIFSVGASILAVLLVLPGLAFRWWRDRQFRNQFELQFESRGYRKLQHELADARRVHESCMPAQLTSGPVRLHYVYEPMRQIGGDLLFVAPSLADGKIISAVLLDVTGHGIAAALTVNRIVGELQRIFGEDPNASPDRVLAALNRYVCVTLAKHDLYMTAICMRIDASSDRLEYANGGHPSAFLRRCDGQIQQLDSTTYLLGLEGVDGFETAAINAPFHAGDAIVAYTDGAAEAKNSRNAMLGMAGVRRILEKVANAHHAPADWPGDLLRQVCDYRGAPPDDDTLVVSIFRPPQ